MVGPGGEFLALGYGNPKSLISFRELSRNISDLEKTSDQIFSERLAAALNFRNEKGLVGSSFRWVYSEADNLPGLIVDAFKNFERPGSWIFSVQILTLGMETLFQDFLKHLEGLSPKFSCQMDQTAVVLFRDSTSRQKEGLEIRGREVVFNPSNLDLTSVLVQTRTSEVWADLIGGQKTGLFLDQSENIKMALEFFRPQAGKTYLVLDLFSYIGNWGSSLAKKIISSGSQAQITVVDVSKQALSLAEKNIRFQKADVQTLCMDLLRDVWPMENQKYDVVICDPPALIKDKSSTPQGLKAYEKVFSEALIKTKKGGLFLASSCSHHLGPEKFTEVLSKAQARSKCSVQWLARGGHALDHPIRKGFPQGEYLKLWLGRVT